MTLTESRHLEEIDHIARLAIKHARAACDCGSRATCDEALSDLEMALDALAATEPTLDDNDETDCN